MRKASKAQGTQAVLGLDLGTSAVKCVVVAQGRIIASATAPLELTNPRPGWSEQDPADWIEAARTAIAAALKAAPLAQDAIVGVGLSGQMHGAVVLDRSDTPLRPAILWNDNRAVAECQMLLDAVPDIGDLAGIGPMPGFTAPKLMWMHAHEPALCAGIGAVLLPKDYLSLWLTGERSTDTSDAAGTLWLDQRHRCWSTRLTTASGIDIDWLPPLRNGFDLVGHLRPAVACDLGLSSGLPVFAGGGDAATGALSLGAATSGKCFMSLGTSGQLLVVEDHYAPAPDRLVHAYCHTVPDTWFRMAAMLNGARPLAWFAGVLGRSVPEVLTLAAQSDDARVPLFLPYLTGERSPHGNPDIRGCFYGLDDATGAPEMARAVVEAIAFSMGDAKASFGSRFAPSGPIPVIGGGSRSDAVLQALADVLRHPVARASAGEGGAALGAAMLAEVGLGHRDLASLSFDSPLSATKVPRGAAGALLQRFDRYRALYAALQDF